MKETIRQANKMYICAGERLKLIGSVNGYFPDMGHHLAKEMIGMWLHPIKLIDGFWMRFTDNDSAGEVDCYCVADGFENLPYGNKFTYNNNLSHTPISIERFQYSPDEVAGCIVKYSFFNNSKAARSITAELIVRTDLRPVWLAEDIGVVDGKADEIVWDSNNACFIAKDSDNDWFTAFGSDLEPSGHRDGQFFGAEVTAGNGVSGALSYNITLQPFETKTIVFFFAGSDRSKDDLLKQYHSLYSYEALLEQKKKRYINIDKNSQLVVGDKAFQNIYSWVKVNTDWLIQTVPGVGRGLTAGTPEYPWWFGCDSCYAIMGLLASGEQKLARDTLDIVLEASIKCNGNGRIVHEILTNGHVCNPGNTQETAHFVYAVYYYFSWTGDKEFLLKCMPYIKLSMQWLASQDEDNDCFPSGYGIIEIAGLNMEMIDTAVYTCMAYESFAHMCEIINEQTEADIAYSKYEQTKKAILDKFWLPERGLFADAVTSADVVERQLEAILFQSNDSEGTVEKYLRSEIAKKANDTEETGWLLNEAWIINTPLEVGIATKEQAEESLKLLHTDRFIGQYGMYLSGLNHKDTMTISTGAMAVAQARYGYADRALELIERMFGTFSMATPGSISEMSPDYGCFAQAWTIYSVTYPIVTAFFGLKPDAKQSEIAFSPNMPKKWTTASLLDVAMLDGKVSVVFNEKNGKQHYTITSTCSSPLVQYINGKRKAILNGAGTVSVVL